LPTRACGWQREKLPFLPASTETKAPTAIIEPAN
jgi:hypothetical protein